MMTAAEASSASAATATSVDIYHHFRGLIVSGQFGADERLPTVRQTARDLGVAAGTAARAYKLLEQDGLVVSRTAAGTRVAPSAAVVPLAVVRGVRAMVADAHATGVPLEDVISIVRASWPASS